MKEKKMTTAKMTARRKKKMSNTTTQKFKGDAWEWFNELEPDAQEEIIINAFAKSERVVIE